MKKLLLIIGFFIIDFGFAQTADLSVNLSYDITSTLPGNTVIFTIVATNNGSSNATGVFVSFILSTGFTLVSATGSVGNYNTATEVWNVGNLANLATETLYIAAVFLPNGNYQNFACITGNEFDPNLTNNCSPSNLNNNNFAFDNFNYYPNPVKNSLSISNTSIIDSIEISTILGQKMIAKKVANLQTEVDLNTLPIGIYFVKVTSQGKEKTVKVLKQ